MTGKVTKVLVQRSGTHSSLHANNCLCQANLKLLHPAPISDWRSGYNDDAGKRGIFQNEI